MARWGKMFRCVAEAVCGRGLKGLLGFIPFGEALYDIGEDALRRWRQSETEEQMRAGLQASVQAGSAEVVAEAVQTVEEVSATLPQPLSAAQKQTLTAYLTQIPALARQTLKCPEDPTGTTVPVGFSLRQPEDMLPLLPARLPRFQPGEARPELHGWVLEQMLGVGEFGEVWLARHPRLAGTRAAIKYCLDLEAQGRLLPYETQMINRVQEQGTHDGVVALQDADLDARPAWLKYEYVPGGDLTGLIHAWQRDAQLLVQGLPHLLELAEIVAHFHDLDQPIVHRDLKPANVLARPRSKGGQELRITDFGIGGVAARYQLASEARGSQSMGLRMLSYLRGSHTPLYASPEQKLGQAPDPRDDVHALGVIGYQLLTGRLDRGSGVKFVDDLLKAGIAKDVIRLLKKCVDPDREDRLATAGELANRLRPLLSSGAAVVPPPAPAQPASKPAAKPVQVPHPPSLAEVARQKKEERERIHAEARQLEKKSRYADAVQKLEELPPDRRDADYYTSLCGWRDEVIQLDRELWEAAHNDKLTRRLRPKILRLKELLPSRTDLDETLALIPELPATFTNGLGMKFARVPAGTFWMGGGGGQPGDKQVEIADDFYLGVYQVTQEQWQTIMCSNQNHFKGSDLPVEQVSWEDAQEFIRRLNARKESSEWVYRLPTEAEWEYSCREGASSKPDCSFHFYLDRPTNDLSSDQANFDGNHPFGNGRKGVYLKRTTKVGSYKPNRLGIYDMHGNVWEWCQDILQGSQRVVRGGGWGLSGVGCQAGYRFGLVPGDRYNFLGFRLAQVPSGS